MILDTGHTRFEILPGQKDVSWIYAEELSKEEGFRIPTLEELRYLYSLKRKLGLNLQIPDNWVWSSKEDKGPRIEGEGKSYYFLNFRNGNSDWEWGNLKTAIIIKAFDR
jgi:hypothetical protein